MRFEFCMISIVDGLSRGFIVDSIWSGLNFIDPVRFLLRIIVELITVNCQVNNAWLSAGGPVFLGMIENVFYQAF